MNMFKRKTLVISERDPEYQVRYLGNVLTAFVKGDGCVDKPTHVLWNNYLSNCANSSTGKAGLDMDMRICASGLKVVTKDQGLTEYRAHRITYSICPKINPKMFVWVYRHDGKKLKPEVRCHAVLCKTEHIARTIASQLQERRQAALDEFRREKKRRQNSRLLLLTRSNSVPSEVMCPGGGAIRTKFLVTGQNFRPSIDRSTSAPKLGLIAEGIEEEPFMEDVNTVRRRSLLSIGISTSPPGSNRNSDMWLTEECEDADDDNAPVTFSIPEEDIDDDMSRILSRQVENHVRRSIRRYSDSDNSPSLLIDDSLSKGLQTIHLVADDDVTNMSVEMYHGTGISADSDDDSTESGFSEQDIQSLDY